jgi:hypothetical protein
LASSTALRLDQPLEGDQAQLREEVRGSNPLSSTLWN